MIDWLASIDMQGHWWWLILAAILGIAEIIMPGIFLIWIAIAAGLTGLIAVATGIALPIQIILFAALCLIATYAGRRWYAGNPVESADPLLNDRAARLVGDIVTVVEAIDNGRGRVKVGDGVWNCAGPDAEAGSRVRIIGADGAVLRVEGV